MATKAQYHRKRLKEKISTVESDDPDQYLSYLWLHNEHLYERLFLERAEWVMILETSLALLIGSIIFSIHVLIRSLPSLIPQ